MMTDPCLFCLSGGGRELGLETLANLVHLWGDDDEDGDGAVFLCPECDGTVAAAGEIVAEISALKLRLKTELDRVRHKIVESEGSALEIFGSGKLLRLRKSFLLSSDENKATPSEMVQIKIDTEDDDNYDDGPCSPSAFMLEPEPDDDMEFGVSEVLEVKTEIGEIDTEFEPRVQQKRKPQPKIRIDTPRRSTRVKQSLVIETIDIKPEITPNPQEKTAKPKKTTISKQKRGKKTPPVAPLKVKTKSKAKTYRTPYFCAICNKKCRNYGQMIYHLFANHETEDKPFSCEKCGKCFTLELNLKRHIKLHKRDVELPLVCDICDGRFENQAGLDAHATAHSRKKYPCDLCDKVLLTTNGRLRHMRIHTGEKPYKCEFCDEGFADSGLKRTHIEKFHKKGQVEFPCTLCDKVFDTTAGLKSHLYLHAGKGCFSTTCKDCGQDFNSWEARKKHQIKVHGAKAPPHFVCDECGATLKSYGAIKNHKLVHTGVRNFKCDICQAAFLTSNVLHNHMLKHKAQRQYVCKFCGQAFKFRNNLNEHEKYIHSSGPGRNYKLQCPHCPKKFEFQSRLDGHIRQAHTAERPFACHVSSCNQRFAIKTSLTHHLKSHGIFPSKTDRAPRSKKDDFSSISNEIEESRSEGEGLSNEMQEMGQTPNYSGNGMDAIPNFNFPTSSNFPISFPSQFY